MNSLDEVLALRDLDVEGAAAFLEVGVDTRRPITGYEGLKDVEVIDSKETGIRFILRGSDVVLVHIGSDALPAGVDSSALQKAAGTEGKTLRSRQGKRAHLHVAADAGMAWSELEGQVGFVQLFPPTTFDRYVEAIYKEPGPFRK